MSNRAWVTLATNDSYGLGALVLAHSLRRVGSTYPAVILITPSVTDAMRDRLRAVFAEVITVDVLDSQDAAHLALLQRPELGITFTKIHCWNLTQYDRCVFLDADILVVQNCDELFEREELSAAPDVGWPDCFNSGVFVFQPSADTFSRLINFAQERGSFDGGDQGLLNSFFSSWSTDNNKRLPFLYNVTSAAFYSYLPALKHYGQNLKILHFIGPAKPWLQHYNFESQSVDAPEHLKGFLQLWWDLFTSQVHTQLDVSMTGVAGNLARVQPGTPLQREAIDELTRRQGWESGNIDYMGADSFANIWAKISQTLNEAPSSPLKQPSPPKDSPPALEEPAKEVTEELAEKVAVTSLSDVPDIPVPAREAINEAGKMSDTSSSITIPQIVPEASITEADIKTGSFTVPNETVVAAEICQSLDAIPSATSEGETSLQSLGPEKDVAKTSAILVSSPVLHETEPLEPTSSETKEVHEVKQMHENDISKIDSVSEKPLDVHAAEPVSENPIDSSTPIEPVPIKSSESALEPPLAVSQEDIVPTVISDVPESKPVQEPSDSSKVECLVEAPESKSTPETESIPSVVHDSKPAQEPSDSSKVECSVEAPESKSTPETESIPSVVHESKPAQEPSESSKVECSVETPESKSTPETESIPSVVHESKPAEEPSDSSKVECAIEAPESKLVPEIESIPSVVHVSKPTQEPSDSSKVESAVEASETMPAPVIETVPSVVHESKPASETDVPKIEAINPISPVPTEAASPEVPEPQAPEADIQKPQVTSPSDTPKSESISAPAEPQQDKIPDKSDAPASDSPPLANTPSQEEIPSVTAAKCPNRACSLM
ncbi:cell surface glycoprotein 1 isoform X2 [Zerene cesonia]|uniref:cell surface glycoprotein 1 isoform X2 n=1 Tax=Zerene cesonia TaxID=33412 RepID=UPI0018E52F07|nr:cell surface glycoprotein 1 isoform X2 [Zerene cesonia]